MGSTLPTRPIGYVKRVRYVRVSRSSPGLDAADREDSYEYKDMDRLLDPTQPPENPLSPLVRATMLIASMLVLVVILGSITWILATRPVDTPMVSAGTLEEAPRVGALAPGFQLIDVRVNQTLKLEALRGKPVFINFWGTWCPPCRAEMPEMQKVYDKYKGQIEMIGISMGPRDDPGGVKSFVDQGNYTWTFIHDPDFEVATRYQAFSIPISYFIDKRGVISSVHIGAMNSRQMETYLEQIR